MERGEKLLATLPPWEALLKKIVWRQLGNIQNKRILDFGSGIGVTADHYARENQVIAIEPNQDSASQRWMHNEYDQMIGSTDQLDRFEAESFDMILCHNVLEYAQDRERIVQEFCRILRPDGCLSLVKHNRPGRVMQMVVLLNDFDSAHSLLDGKDGTASQYGTIRYYDDSEVLAWCHDFCISKMYGIRTFWDLQQNQEIHKDAAWQQKMVDVEMRVAEIKEYQEIAFFHHLLLTKQF